jgi:hypothetical protein
MSGEEEKNTSIAVREPELIAPASIEKTLEALKRFEEFKRRVLTEDDYVTMTIRNEKRKYIKKSGWLKYALACSISLEKREEREEIKDDGTRVYHYTYRAIAPSGRFADAVGSASSEERDFAHEVHDVRALAQTRAMERAISNLVGGGELGAEEMLGVEEQTKTSEVKPAPVAEMPKPKPAEAAPTKVPAENGTFPLKSSGKTWGYFKRTEGGGELYFDSPLDMENPGVRMLVESFLYGRVLDGMKKARAEKDLMFEYTPIIENGKLVGISFVADLEAMDDMTIKEICSSAGWTAARATEKKV